MQSTATTSREAEAAREAAPPAPPAVPPAGSILAPRAIPRGTHYSVARLTGLVSGASESTRDGPVADPKPARGVYTGHPYVADIGFLGVNIRELIPIQMDTDFAPRTEEEAIAAQGRIPPNLLLEHTMGVMEKLGVREKCNYRYLASGSYGAVFRRRARGSVDATAVKVFDSGYFGWLDPDYVVSEEAYTWTLITVAARRARSERGVAGLIDDVAPPANYGSSNVVEILRMREFPVNLSRYREMENLMHAAHVLVIDMPLYKGNLHDWRYEHRTRMLVFAPSRERIEQAVRGLVKGLAFLHSIGIQHGDLRLENVMYTDADGVFKVAIGDFSSSCSVRQPFKGVARYRELENRCALMNAPLEGCVALPMRYDGPEAREPDERIALAFDVFSLGVCIALLRDERVFDESMAVYDRLRGVDGVSEWGYHARVFGSPPPSYLAEMTRNVARVVLLALGDSAYSTVPGTPAPPRHHAEIAFGTALRNLIDVANLGPRPRLAAYDAQRPLVRWMLNADPRARPTSSQVVAALAMPDEGDAAAAGAVQAVNVADPKVAERLAAIAREGKALRTSAVGDFTVRLKFLEERLDALRDH